MSISANRTRIRSRTRSPYIWDAAGTIPAAQPLRTVNGYIVNAGGPANVFFDGAYSELVQDSNGRQVFFARTAASFSVAIAVSAFIAGLASEQRGRWRRDQQRRHLAGLDRCFARRRTVVHADLFLDTDNPILNAINALPASGGVVVMSGRRYPPARGYVRQRPHHEGKREAARRKNAGPFCEC
jgi:hypothetical protein